MSQPTLRVGSSGSAVVLLQQRLNTKGFPVKADGDFGAKTEQAVEQFQAACGLRVDGIVGSITWGLLMAEGKAPTPAEVLLTARGELMSKIPSGIPALPFKALQALIEKLGYKEIPDGSNGGPEIAEIVEGPGGDGKPPSAYYLYWGVTDKATLQTLPPWCVLACCWSVRRAKGGEWKDLPWGDWFGGVSQIEDWARKVGPPCWRPVSSDDPAWRHELFNGPVEPGMLFTISRAGSSSDAASSTRAGHIGFVVADNGDGTFVSVEGNVSNAVGSHTRRKADCRGFIKWW